MRPTPSNSSPTSFVARRLVPASASRLLALSAGTLACILLAGCDQDTAGRQARATATQVDAAATASGSAEQHARAVATAASGMGEGTGSAALLPAQASLAQAEADTEAVLASERTVRGHLVELSRLASQWSGLGARASTAEGFKPTAQVDAFADDQRRKEEELAQNEAARTELSTRIEGLRTQAQGLLGESQTLFNQAASLEQRAAAVSAREGVPLIEESARLRRQGDQLRVQGELVSAEVETLQPQLTELEAIARQLGDQRQRLIDAQNNLRERQVSLRDEARTLRNEAEQVRDRIDQLTGAVLNEKNQTYQPAFDKARSGFAKAQQAASRAGQDAGASGRLVQGNAQLAAASLTQSRADMLAAIAGAYAQLAKVEPALPNRSDFAAQASQVREELKTVVEEGQQLLSGARSAFSGVQVRGDARERLNALTEQLARLDGSAEENAQPEEGQEGEMSGGTEQASGGASGEADASGVPQQARDAMTQFLVASAEGDAETAVGLLHTTTPVGEMFRESTRGTVQAAGAARRVFDKSLIEVLRTEPTMGAMMAQQFEQMGVPSTPPDPSTLTYQRISDEQVVAMIPGQPMPTQLVLVDGQWKVSLSAMEQMMANVPPQIVEMMGKQGTAFSAWATRVDAREFETPEAAAQALVASLVQLMQQAQPGAGEGAGDGAGNGTGGGG